MENHTANIETTTQSRIPGLSSSFINFCLRNSMLLVLLALILISTIVSKGIFIRPANLVTLLFQTSIVGVLAIGQTLAILSGGLDLSVASLTILIALIMGGLSSQEQAFLPYTGVLLAILIGLAMAAFIGLVNGLIIAKTRIPPFIVTLAMLLIATGLSFLLTGGAPIYYPAKFFENFGQSKLWILPYPVLVWFILTLVFAYFLSRTKYGAMLYAVGGNEKAALLSGLPTHKIRVLVYALSGLLAGFGGFLFLARTGYAIPSAGQDFLLESIAVVVVGGVSLTGGRGTLLNTFLGILILAILGNLMNILLISPYIQSAVEGVIILMAVMANIRIAGD